MSAPCSGPPQEVFIGGQCRLRGISMCRAEPFVDQPANSHPVLIDGPASMLAWKTTAEHPINIAATDSGSIAVTIEPQESFGAVYVPLDSLPDHRLHAGIGLSEVTAQVETAEPGTGIFLGDRTGQPVYQVRFVRDGASQQILFALMRPDGASIQKKSDFKDAALPYEGTSIWLKMVVGPAIVRVQVSGDGRHWGQLFDGPKSDLLAAIGSFGIFGSAGSIRKTIRVREIQLRELNGITQFADSSLRSEIGSFTDQELTDISDWNDRVAKTRPSGREESSWLAANAISALWQGPPNDLGRSLLDRLVTLGMNSDRTWEQKRQLLDDVCLLSDLFDEAAAKSVLDAYEQLGWQIAQSGQSDPISKILSAIVGSPLWTRSSMQSVWERLSSHEMIQAVYRRDWSAAWSIAQSVSYWTAQPSPDFRLADHTEVLDRHARWAKSLAVEFNPALDDGSAAVLPAGLRHPLILALNKEAYNVRAELLAALSSGSDDDACRIATSIGRKRGIRTIAGIRRPRPVYLVGIGAAVGGTHFSGLCENNVRQIRGSRSATSPICDQSS